MTPASLHRLYASLIGLLLLVSGFFWFRQSERHAGAIAQLTKEAEARTDTLTRRADSASTVAQKAEEARQAALTLARRQVAASEALRAKTDSAAKAASEARDAARKLLDDSVATISQLRAGLAALDSASRADSVASANQHHADQSIAASLLATIAADSLALTAERQRSASLQALAANLGAEVKLLRAQQPSAFGQGVKLVIAAAAGFGVGRFR